MGYREGLGFRGSNAGFWGDCGAVRAYARTISD